MEPVANHNPSVCCWNCDHFQRFSSKPQPDTCDGECRVFPPGNSILVTALVSTQGAKGLQSEIQEYFPHILCGLRYRCSHFVSTSEPNNPQSPTSFDCQLLAPSNTLIWEPWIKPGRESCWSCNWFEPELCPYKNQAQPDNGTCLFNPPAPRRFHQFERILPKIELGTTPTVRQARLLWCSCWQGPRPELNYAPGDQMLSPRELHSQWEQRNQRAIWSQTLLLQSVPDPKREKPKIQVVKNEVIP